jgi:hypothetical protein
MISERTFATSFHDFWQDLLPILTPSYVQHLNLNSETKIFQGLGKALPEVTSKISSQSPSMISEFAYHLFSASLAKGISTLDGYQDDEILDFAKSQATNLISLYEGREANTYNPLNQDELTEGYELSLRYEAFVYKTIAPRNITMPLSIRGAGFLNECNADMLLDDYLVEVKTVKRKVMAKDIRQLVIYLALNYASGNGILECSGFLNPRRSTYLKFNSTKLLKQISGGKALVDIFSQLIDFACSSDLQFDASF